MALSVNRVLTAVYHAIYEDANEADELVLLTAPLSSTTEIQALFEAQLIDFESALPAALHSLGCSASEIEGALERRRKLEKSSANTELMAAQTAAAVGDADVALKAAQTAKTTEEIAQVQAATKKTEAEVGVVEATEKKTAAEVGKVGAEQKKTEHDAKAPFPSAASAGPPSGGSKSAAKKDDRKKK